MDEDDHNRRINTLGHPLAQPVSIPVSNGLRYNAQATASMQDVSYVCPLLIWTTLVSLFPCDPTAPVSDLEITSAYMVYMKLQP